MNKKQKSLTNKGFSLVELIIVIAIMAVLVGVLAPQYIKYLDKSKISADTQLADNVRNAITNTLLDPAVTKNVPTNTDYATLGAAPGTADSKDFWQNVYEILGESNKAGVISNLKYDNSTTGVDIQFKIDSNKKVSVQVTGGKYTGDKLITVE